jgi:hypothetical protein
MTTSRRRLLQAAAVAPVALVAHRPLRLFGGDAAAMAADGLSVPTSGLKIDGRDLIGHSLSWTDSDVTAADVRARTVAGWTPWAEVHADRGHGPDDPAREHSPPILVPGAIEYEIAARPGTADLRIHPLAAEAPAAARYAAPSTTSPIPGLEIIDRDNWTDQPRLQSWDCVIRSSLYGDGCRSDVGLRHALVHHTVTVNDYAASTVPALLVGIRRYHVETRGWDDIAYNFVIDRWGRIWQARDADIREPITGGHTTGLNSESVGVAVLGEFGDHRPSEAVVDSISLLLGWKLSIHGVDPLGMNVVRSSGGDFAEVGEMVKVRNIAGHRDHQITGCPGNELYARLGAIRTAAAELVPVYGYVGPAYHPDKVVLEGWVIERFSPTSPVTVEIAVDGVEIELMADLDVRQLNLTEFDLAQYQADNPEAGRAHGFRRTIPIDLDTRSITVVAKASDGRTASLVDLVLFATFVDVEPDLWYSDAIYWLRETELTTGTAAGLFEPKDLLTRAQMAAFLWRFMDRPVATGKVPFIDVPADLWYTDAVRWLHREGITTGTGPDTFAPQEFITRGQMATFLWRLCGQIEPENATPFSDVVPGSYYETAVAWLRETGITTGVSATEFAPEQPVTRGEMAVFLHRLASTPAAWTVIEPSSFVTI